MTPPKPLPTDIRGGPGESVTDLTRCNHGTPPIPNCPRCLNRDLADALWRLMRATEALSRWCPACGCNRYLEHKDHYEPCSWTEAVDLIEKAKLIVDEPAEDDLIPREDAPEAAAGDGHRW